MMNIARHRFTKAPIRALIAACCIILPIIGNAAEKATPLQLKAALIYKMGMFVNWKNPPPIKNYCFIGKKGIEVSEILEGMAKGGKLPKPINITLEDSLLDVDRYQCQVLYVAEIDSDEEEHLQKLSQSTLTLVDNASQLKQGGLASIEIENRRPRLYASLGNLKASNIEIHSRLLSSMTLID